MPILDVTFVDTIQDYIFISWVLVWEPYNFFNVRSAGDRVEIKSCLIKRMSFIVLFSKNNEIIYLNKKFDKNVVSKPETIK